MTPNDIVADPGTYAGFFPSGTEPNPRVDYMTLVVTDGLLANAYFGWTKNEVVARFDYDGSVQRFRTLPGGPLLVVGQVATNINTNRLVVPAPTQITSPSAAAPWRLSVGTGSGVTFTTTLVSTFGSPAVGTVEILTTTGELNWNPTDLTTYSGQSVRFQRQAFFGFNESNGKLGVSTDALLLNPLPATTQYPLLRLGYGAWLTPVERPNEASFSVDPSAGTFEWAIDTGRVKLHSTDASSGKPVYYDGVLIGAPAQLPRVSVGTVATPASFSTPLVGGDLIFTLGATQFPYFSYVTSFDPVGQTGTVQLLTSGPTTSIQFSLADQTRYGAAPVTLVFGDLPIERGISLRLFRTPVNLSGTGTTKDVSSIYAVTGATFSNPIMGSPDVFLPQVPRDDGSLVVSVGQGTGTFPPATLPLLDGSVPLPVAPGPTYGYLIDYDNKKLRYALRKNDVLIPFTAPTGALVLPDPLVQTNGLSLALETGIGTNVYTPLTIGTDVLFDGNATVTFAETVGTLITSGNGSFSGTSLSDATGDFTHVASGDLITASGHVYSVSSVTDAHDIVMDVSVVTPGTFSYEIRRGDEILVDRYFAPIELVDPSTSITRTMTPGPLKINQDYTISPALGFINFSKRFLALEGATITYVGADPTTGNPTSFVEPAVFLVRKEVCQPHPAPTSVLYFNPLGRTVASTPAPAVFRGGRPQVLGVQCVVDTVASTITFLPDTQITDALPHGATVNPNENIYIDYYVTQAIGGEQSITVQNPPMSIAQVVLAQDGTSFVVAGDQTGTFTAGYLLRVEQLEIHLLSTVTYNPTTNQTTVALTAGDSFQDAYNNPRLYQTSGLIRTAPSFGYPSYFVFDLSAYAPIPRGMNTITVTGDRTSSYKQGTVVRLTDAGVTFQHFYLVSGAALNNSGNTIITLTSNTRQQYTPGTHFLSYSVRAILEAGATSTSTSMVPVLTQPYTVFRRVEGQAGSVLTLQTDYTIDSSGRVVYTPPLVPNEELAILYTGHVIEEAGLRLQASYTAITAPTTSNGLINQQLNASYTLFSPDTFYFRVETLTNFRAEIAQDYENAAKSSVPSGGPITSNTASGPLYTKGRPSLYFDEGHLANEDVVARISLKWYNDTINQLEDTLQDMDGRVVGHHSGRFLFDGTTGVKHPPGPVTNQIDDLFEISPAPYGVTYPPFAVTSIGTYQALYLPSQLSRFFPTASGSFGVIAGGANTGDSVYDTGHKNLTNVSGVQTRLAWALLTQDVSTGGSVTITVDNTAGSKTIVRPPFRNGMQCVVQRADGSIVNSAVSPVTVTVIDQTHLSLTGLAGPVTAGATIFRSPSDASVQTGTDVLTYYQFGRDYSFDPNSGQITYIKPFPPYDGSVPSVPAALEAVPLVAGQPLDAFIGFSNTNTAPSKFPALYGSAIDDDGDMAFPIISPSFDCETTVVGDAPSTTTLGHLSDEDGYLTRIQAVTTLPYLGTGNLTALDTVHLTSGTFPSPVPKHYDLVRITSGANAGSAYRRIIAVTGNTVQVDTPWPTLDTGFQFEVSVSSTVLSGTGVFTTSTITDAFANFSSVQVGWTVVVTSGLYAGYRLQVTAVTSTTQLALSAGLPGGGTFTYRVDNSLATFGGTGSLLDQLGSELLALVGLYTDALRVPTAEVRAMQNFLEQLFTNVLVGSNGQTTGTTFTDNTVDFVAGGVIVGQVLYIEFGSVRGIYQVQAVTTNTLTVDVAFPGVTSGVSYRVVQFFGVSVQAMRDTFAVLAATQDFVTATTAFESLATTVFPVVKPGPVVDSTAFATAFLGPELSARATASAARQTAVQTAGTGYTSVLSNILGGSENLYNIRYTWIDARIDMKDGIIVKQARAVASRIQAQADVVNQLFKLLAVQGG